MTDAYTFPRKSSCMAVLLLCLGLSQHTQAQIRPDAGQTLQQVFPQRLEPPVTSSTPLELTPPANSADIMPGGAVVQLEVIRFKGNTVFSSAVLDDVLGPYKGKNFDLAGLNVLANQLSSFYRQFGYPFANVFVPAQRVVDGVVQMDVVEGRYGQVQALSDEPQWVEQAEVFLRDLQPGQVIESSVLERATLILDDLPGVRVNPIIRPGKKAETADLDITLLRESSVTGDVGLDNYGNRYTGEIRSRANININSPFMLGDQIKVSALYTQEKLWFANVGYSLAVGGSGLTAQVGYAHTSYQLGREFAGLQSYGTAKVSSLGLSYPMVRSQEANLSLSTVYQHKQLNDNTDSTTTRSHKSSNSLPVNLQFDVRDGWGGGGLSYGVMSWTVGQLDLDANLLSADTAQTRGSFQKLSFDLARVQNLWAPVSLYGRFAGQRANKNLDSSEGFSLGGANGVRAYPTGEASGDEGWLVQLELRYNAGFYSPYVFHDTGYLKVDARSNGLANSSPDQRRAGAGFGMRYNAGPWRLDGSLAWRTRGGPPQADTSSDPNPRVWLSLGYLI